MAIHSYPDLIFSAGNLPRMTCMTCGDPMTLILIEPMPNHFDIRTFSCKTCDILEAFVIDLDGS